MENLKKDILKKSTILGQMKDFFDYMEEHKEEIEQELYIVATELQNNLSYWFDKIKDVGFVIPKTQTIRISLKWFNWLKSDNYQSNMIEKFNNYLISQIDEELLNAKVKFIKTGNFSNKFDFTDCKITDNQKIGEKFLNIFYRSMIVSCESSNEFVIREFIETNYDRGYIYNGMKLNTEFRVFYDFDKKEVLGMFNYWDRNVVLSNINVTDEDKIIFNKNIDAIEADFNNYKDELEKQCLEKLKKVKGLEGIWSVDFLFDGKNFVLIDMALANQSYYFDRIQR